MGVYGLSIGQGPQKLNGRHIADRLEWGKESWQIFLDFSSKTCLENAAICPIMRNRMTFETHKFMKNT